MGRWVGYDPDRLAGLARRTGEAIAHLDATTLADPVAADAVRTIRTVAFSLGTTWLPVLARVGTDTTLWAWGPRGPGRGGWTAHQTIGVATAPEPPVDGGADAVAAWWRTLSEEQRTELIEQRPLLVGNTDGIPATARDQANRIQLAVDLDALEAAEAAGTLSDHDGQILTNIRRAQAALGGNDAYVDPLTGDPVGGQLYLYDPRAFGGDGRIAIAVGNVDTAAHVAVAVTGLGSDASRISAEQSQAIYAESRHASGDPVAVLAWMGYDAPSFSTSTLSVAEVYGEVSDVAGVLNQDDAGDGAVLLAADVAGLNAMRGGIGAHVTVIGNSYGSTTVAIAADEHDLEADDLVLTGSPGAGAADTAADLTTGTEHTWVASASSDVVTYLGATPGWVPQDLVADLVPGVQQLGDDPADASFGAQRIQAEHVDRQGGGAPGNVADHGRYYDEDSECLANIGAIVGGEYDLVTAAAPRPSGPSIEFDLDLVDLSPYVGTNLFPDDPEADRQPALATHEP